LLASSLRRKKETSGTPPWEQYPTEVPQPSPKKIREEEWLGMIERLTQPKNTAKIERLKKQLEEKELAEVKRHPEMDANSKTIAAKLSPFFERMNAQQEQAEKKKESLRKQIEQQELNAYLASKSPKSPRITHTKEDTTPKSPDEKFNVLLDKMSRWEQMRRDRMKMAKEKTEEEKLKDCSFQPSISSHSQKMIEARFGHQTIQERAETYERIRQQRMQQLRAMVEAEQNQRIPKINERSKRLKTNGPAHDRLYMNAKEVQLRKLARQEEMFLEYYKDPLFIGSSSLLRALYEQEMQSRKVESSDAVDHNAGLSSPVSPE
jgi:hypothetical protein